MMGWAWLKTRSFGTVLACLPCGNEWNWLMELSRFGERRKGEQQFEQLRQPGPTVSMVRIPFLQRSLDYDRGTDFSVPQSRKRVGAHGPFGARQRSRFATYRRSQRCEGTA